MFGDGSTTMADTTSQLSIRPYGASTSRWSDGPLGNIRTFEDIDDGLGIGWSASFSAKGICLPIGVSSGDTAEQWEPYEPRGSRTVLRARGGAIPPRDSPPSPPRGP